MVFQEATTKHSASELQVGYPVNSDRDSGLVR
jgi:hypothetical protein